VGDEIVQFSQQTHSCSVYYREKIFFKKAPDLINGRFYGLGGCILGRKSLDMGRSPDLLKNKSSSYFNVPFKPC